MTCEDCKFYNNECESHSQSQYVGITRNLEVCEIFCPKPMYIDKNALIDDLEAAKNNGGMGATLASTLIRYVKRCPTMNAVVVVRCKDCKYAKNMAPIGESKYLLGECFLREEDEIAFMVYDDDFCSYGERKDNEVD